MNPTQADERITLSRQTLYRYRAMIDGRDIPTADISMWQNEISELEAIAEEHPGKALKIERLVADWRALIAGVRGKMN